MITASAWRIKLGNITSHTYRLQTSGINQKNVKKVMKLLKDWKVVATIFSNNSKKYNDFVFQKKFKNDQQWNKWAKGVEIPLIEYSSTSDSIKTDFGAKKSKKNKRTKKKRKILVCGKCGLPGHNARTCAGEKKNIKRKERQCSYCREFGHNKRTCREYKRFVERKRKKLEKMK